MVESVRELVGGKTERETRYYISSLSAAAERQRRAIRNHWGVASRHWEMDMVFRVLTEACFQHDECCIRRENAPANFAPWYDDDLVSLDYGAGH